MDYRFGDSIINSVMELQAVCTLVVTFMDGVTKEYPNIRFQESLSEPNPIKVNGTTVEIENDEQTITLLGVREFKLEFPLN
jgi:sorbitol-specific phosphotransferase system component IIA